eukprot:134503-Chlamydomonas_euryale.AAC.4
MLYLPSHAHQFSLTQATPTDCCLIAGGAAGREWESESFRHASLAETRCPTHPNRRTPTGCCRSAGGAAGKMGERELQACQPGGHADA